MSNKDDGYNSYTVNPDEEKRLEDEIDESEKHFEIESPKI